MSFFSAALARLQAWARGADAAIFVSAVSCVGYFAVSSGARNFYPFTVYKMFTESGLDTASRLMLLEEDGGAHEIDDYGRFDCGPIAAAPELCEIDHARFIVQPQIESYMLAHVASHRGPAGAGVAVRIVRRIWTFESATQPMPPHRDCLVASCRAKRL